MIRCVYHFSYADGVSTSDGDTWYLGEHVPQVNTLLGIIRHRSWKSVMSWVARSIFRLSLIRLRICLLRAAW